jgi:hypothetical protein
LNPTQFEKHGVDKRTALNTHNEFAQCLHFLKSSSPPWIRTVRKGRAQFTLFETTTAAPWGFPWTLRTERFWAVNGSMCWATSLPA